MTTTVIDTNVVVAGLRSRHGNSNKLLKRIGDQSFDFAISAPIILEYESVLKRPGMVPYTHSEIDEILDFLCRAGQKYSIYYRWRPWLKDEADNMILELTIHSSADFIITFNKDDFNETETFSFELKTPKEFLDILKEEKQ